MTIAKFGGTKRTLAALAVSAAIGLGLTGLGSDRAMAEGTLLASQDLRDLLPAKVREAGTINIAISLAYAPMEYSDAGSTDLKGADIDLAKEAMSRLGLKPNFQNVDFSQLIASVKTGRADMIWTAFSDLAKRQDDLDFIDYFKTGNQIFAPVENQGKIKEIKDLCGKTAAIATGTSWVTFMQDLSKSTCAADNQINVMQIPTEAEQLLQMKQDRAQASMIGFEGVLDLQKQQPGKYYKIGGLLEPGHYGIAFAKHATQLRDAVKAALDSMKADGTYLAILDRYGLKEAAVDSFTINAGK